MLTALLSYKWKWGVHVKELTIEMHYQGQTCTTMLRVGAEEYTL